VATVSEPKLMTAREFMASDLGEGRFELVQGEVIEVRPPRPEHGRVTSKTGFALETFGRGTGYGYCITEAAVRTERNPDTVRGPDLSFYSHARWPEHQIGSGLPPVPPDLAVEILSPANRRGPILKKVAEYQVAGVLMVWVVNPTRRHVVVYRLQEDDPVIFREGDTLEGFPELPGFRCLVSDLFPPVAPQ
jgi:Uma2 family endonuclease